MYFESDNIRKLKRTAKLLAVLSKYGFEEILERIQLTKIIPNNLKEKSEKLSEVLSLSVYERVRMALEELGPAYVKLGQMFSNRADLLPKELINELQKLQDKIGQEPVNVKEKLANELRIDPNDYFEWIEEKPLASASIAQVFKAMLKNKNLVVLKIKRENIREIIECDLLILKDLANVFESYNENYKNINLSYILKIFDESIHKELSLANELNNIERFKRNFNDNIHVHVPTVYKELSNDNILCMEFINGIKVTEKDKIEEASLDVKHIAVEGFVLYVQQVLEYGFFHADPHPGNIFVTFNGKIAFIDFGSMGILLPKERELLEDFLYYLLQKNTKKLIVTIKKIAIDYAVSNEKQLERDVYEIMDIVDKNSLKSINLSLIVDRLRFIFSHNKITLPEHFYLLLKGITQIEGIVRHLDPDLDVFQLTEQYAQDTFIRRISPKYLFSKGLSAINNLSENLMSLPVEVRNVLQKLNNNEIKLTHEIPALFELQKSADRLVLAMIISALSIGSAVLVMADMPPKLFGVPILGFLGFTFSGAIGIYIVISLIKSKKK